MKSLIARDSPVPLVTSDVGLSFSRDSLFNNGPRPIL